MIRFKDIEADDDPPYVIDGLLPAEGVAVVWGPPKCFKTFWLLHATFHVSLGGKYGGREVRQGPVVYIAFEGGQGLKTRVRALRMRHPDAATKDPPFHVIARRASVVLRHPQLIRDVEKQSGGEVPRVIVLDTLNASMGGLSESKDIDMGRYIDAADALRERFDCLVVISHHCGYDKSHMRGHTSLSGFVTAELMIERAGLNLTVSVKAMRDGPDGDEVEPVRAHLEKAEVVTKSGLVKETMVVVLDEDGPAPPKDKSERSLSLKQKRALDALVKLINKYGEPLPPELGEGTFQAVSVERWNEELYDLDIVDRKHSNPRTACKQLREALVDHGRIGIRKGFVWILI
jgi:hypothetical protein